MKREIRGERRKKKKKLLKKINGMQEICNTVSMYHRQP